MKNLKIAVAALTAASALVASGSALAATTVSETDTGNMINFVQATYDNDGVLTAGNTVEITNMPSDIANGEVTLVVLDSTITSTSTTIADSNILFLNQGTYAGTNPFASKKNGLTVSDIVKDAEAKFATAVAADSSLTEKTYSYPVRLGYYKNVNNELTFAMQTASIDVKVATESVPSVTIVWGDVNNSGDVTVTDATAIINAILGGTKTYGDYTIGEKFVGDYVWGDINNSTDISVTDATAIINAILGGTKTYGDFTIGVEATLK